MPKARKSPTSVPELEGLREEAQALDSPYSLPAEYGAITEGALKGLVEQRPAAPSVAPVDSGADPRDKETWDFNFDWTDSRGKRFAGKFTNRILSLGLLQRVAAAQAMMQQGQPIEAISPGMLVVNNAIAHMMFSLIERPAWAKDLTALTSVSLVMELWGKVRSHEDHYFRSETAAETGAQSDEE